MSTEFEFIRSQEADFELLSIDQQEVVKSAYGSDSSHMCSGCAVYVGKTHMGEHTYFWHYGVSDGYVVLAVVDENPHYDYESGHITVGGREFTIYGTEIIPPPFQYLIHVDLRKYNTHYLEQVKEGFASKEDEDNFLICCGGGSNLPERAALSAGVKSKVGISWAANYWLAPWELTEELTRSALAITMVYPDDRRVIVL